MSVLVPCDLVEESPELIELRNLVEEYDWLFELCMTEPLSNENQKTLDELYGCLLLKEYEQWEGVSDELIEMIREHVDIDFPMIRHELRLLPNRDY